MYVNKSPALIHDLDHVIAQCFASGNELQQEWLLYRRRLHLKCKYTQMIKKRLCIGKKTCRFWYETFRYLFMLEMHSTRQRLNSDTISLLQNAFHLENDVRHRMNLFRIKKSCSNNLWTSLLIHGLWFDKTVSNIILHRYLQSGFKFNFFDSLLKLASSIIFYLLNLSANLLFHTYKHC